MERPLVKCWGVLTSGGGGAALAELGTAVGWGTTANGAGRFDDESL